MQPAHGERPVTAAQPSLEILDLLVEHEEALQELYSFYATAVAGSSDFWSRLATEESEHGATIRALRHKVEDGSVQFRPGRFSVPALASSLEHVRGQLAKAKDTPVSLAQALSTALDLEKGLIEASFYEVFEGDDPQLQHVLERLAAATREHRDRIQKAWEENR